MNVYCTCHFKSCQSPPPNMTSTVRFWSDCCKIQLSKAHAWIHRGQGGAMYINCNQCVLLAYSTYIYLWLGILLAKLSFSRVPPLVNCTLYFSSTTGVQSNSRSVANHSLMTCAQPVPPKVEKRESLDVTPCTDRHMPCLVGYPHSDGISKWNP